MCVHEFNFYEQNSNYTSKKIDFLIHLKTIYKLKIMNTLRIGKFILFNSNKDQPCKIIAINKSKPGKHWKEEIC